MQDIFEDETTTETGEREGDKATFASQEVGEIDVLTPANALQIGRDAQGRWLPGQQPKGGRPTKQRETAVLTLMRAKIPAERIVETVLDLLDDKTSWRAREAGVKLYLAYMVGMPVQRSVTATTRLESILNRLGEMDDDEFAQVESELRAGQ